LPLHAASRASNILPGYSDAYAESARANIGWNGSLEPTYDLKTSV